MFSLGPAPRCRALPPCMPSSSSCSGCTSPHQHGVRRRRGRRGRRQAGRGERKGRHVTITASKRSRTTSQKTRAHIHAKSHQTNHVCLCALDFHGGGSCAHLPSHSLSRCWRADVAQQDGAGRVTRRRRFKGLRREDERIEAAMEMDQSMTNTTKGKGVGRRCVPRSAKKAARV